MRCPQCNGEIMIMGESVFLAGDCEVFCLDCNKTSRFEPKYLQKHAAEFAAFKAADSPAHRRALESEEEEKPDLRANDLPGNPGDFFPTLE